MKKWIVACLALASMGLHAQGRYGERQHRHHGNELTPTQTADLQAKRMTLALDLDQKQTEQVAALLTQRLEDQEARRKTRAEEEPGQSSDADNRYERMSDHLDQEIAFQRELQSILSDSQYETWREHHLRKRQRDRHQNRGRKR
jgi:hypothetical protein